MADIILIVLGLSDALDVEYELVMEDVKKHLTGIEGEHGAVVVVVNKLDLTGYAKHLEEFEGRFGGSVQLMPVSALNDVNILQLKELIFSALGVVRVYSKTPGKKPDLETPFVLKRGSALIECAGRIHKDFAEKLRYAKLWRKGRYDGMMVSRDFVLEDKDVIELHI